MGDNLGPKGLSGPLFQVEVSEIVVHERDEPIGLVDLFDSGGLAGKDVERLTFLRCRLLFVGSTQLAASARAHLEPAPRTEKTGKIIQNKRKARAFTN
jgi:hypothetical protein